MVLYLKGSFADWRRFAWYQTIAYAQGDSELLFIFL